MKTKKTNMKTKMMVNACKHLKVVLTHKYYVAKYCFKAGLYWQGIVHDLSKLSPEEFMESVRYFHGTISPITISKEKNGWSKAWMHHKGRNKHHYEYWQDEFDAGTKHLDMPFRYVLELLCDYLGAGHAYNGKDFTLQGELMWWKGRNKDGKVAMSPLTWDFVDTMFKTMARENSTDALKPSRNREIYKMCKNRSHSDRYIPLP